MGRARGLTALLMAGALLAAACGSDADEGGGTTPPEPAATDAPAPATDAPEPEPTAAPEPEPTDPPEPAPTDPPEPEPTDPPPTDPPETTTTEPPRAIGVVGLVPLPGSQLDFTGSLVASQSLVWSLYSGSGGIIVENVGGPLPPGCHGVSFFDPETFDLLRIDGKDVEAYATSGDGGCGGMRQDLGDGVVDGDAVVVNTENVIVFDFGDLPAPPFDVSTQVVNPDGGDGVFRSADPGVALFENRLDDADLTHVVGADVLFELADGRLNPIAEPAPGAGDCTGVDVCLGDRFGIDVVNQVGGTPGGLLASGERSALLTFSGTGEWEVLARLVNGCSINDHFWVFAAATTAGVEFDLTVTDTSTGDSRTYGNSLANLAEPILDTAAFATCP